MALFSNFLDTRGFIDSISTGMRDQSNLFKLQRDLREADRQFYFNQAADPMKLDSLAEDLSFKQQINPVAFRIEQEKARTADLMNSFARDTYGNSIARDNLATMNAGATTRAALGYEDRAVSDRLQSAPAGMADIFGNEIKNDAASVAAAIAAGRNMLAPGVVPLDDTGAQVSTTGNATLDKIFGYASYDSDMNYNDAEKAALGEQPAPRDAPPKKQVSSDDAFIDAQLAALRSIGAISAGSTGTTSGGATSGGATQSGGVGRDGKPLTATQASMAEDFKYFGQQGKDNPKAVRPMVMGMHLLRRFESFVDTPFFDTNMLRTGYSSDTVTDERGNSRKTTAADKTTVEAANRDLARRVTAISVDTASAIGGPQWDSLSDLQKAGLMSFTYRWGSLKRSELSTLRSELKAGDTDGAAREMERLQAVENQKAGRTPGSKNKPWNRMNLEAALIRGNPNVGKDNIRFFEPGFRG